MGGGGPLLLQSGSGGWGVPSFVRVVVGGGGSPSSSVW